MGRKQESLSSTSTTSTTTPTSTNRKAMTTTTPSPSSIRRTKANLFIRRRPRTIDVDDGVVVLDEEQQRFSGGGGAAAAAAGGADGNNNNNSRSRVDERSSSSLALGGSSVSNMNRHNSSSGNNSNNGSSGFFRKSSLALSSSLSRNGNSSSSSSSSSPAVISCRKRRLRRPSSTGYRTIVLVLMVMVVLKCCIWTYRAIFSPRGKLRWIYRYAECFTREAGIEWVEAPIHGMVRFCPPPSFSSMTMRDDEDKMKNNNNNNKPRICITTLNDQRKQASAAMNDSSTSILSCISSLFPSFRFRCRAYDQVNTYENQESYARKHGYVMRDGNDMINPSRPPGWSKIPAVQKLMDPSEHCDWVFWMDADVVVMNSDIAVESFLPDDETDPNNHDIHMIAAMDPKYTYNSGSWLVRNSPIGRDFLATWWNQTQLVLPKGASISGDNHAFGYVLTDPSFIFHQYVRQVPRCVMNAYAVFVRKNDPVLTSVEQLQQQEWYLSDKFYHKGDFIAHAGGIDRKDVGVHLLLQRAT